MAANTTSAARAFALLLSLLLLLYRPPIATAQTSSSSGCFTTINSLALRETGVDTTERRTHALCANNIFTIGALDFDNQVYDGQEPIPLRSNLHLKCGFDGLKENNCVVTGGDVQVDGTHFLGVRDSDRLDNVTLEGITFVNAGKYMAWLTKPGTVKFVNCEFRVRCAANRRNSGRFRHRVLENDHESHNNKITCPFFDRKIALLPLPYWPTTLIPVIRPKNSRCRLRGVCSMTISTVVLPVNPLWSLATVSKTD